MAITHPSLKRIVFPIFAAIFMLDVLTPANYVFGHLYIVPILLTACKLYAGGVSFPEIVSTTHKITILSILGVIINFGLFATGLSLVFNITFVPHKILSFSILINDVNVIAVLLLTDWLIRSSLNYMQRIAIQERTIDTKQAQLAAKQAELVAHQEIERMQQDFIYTLTHDLKTPIIGAMRVLEYFRQGKYGAVDARQIEVLDALIRGQHRLYRLVQTLLDIYRNDNQGIVLDLHSIDLCEIATEAVNAMAILGAERQVELNLSCNIHNQLSPRLMGDPLQLDRVFTNLISNAIYHSPSHSTIDITIDDREPYIMTCIADRGLGIAAEDLPFLFDRFYQSSDKLNGSGLGLYLSRQIVTAHRGEIWAESLPTQGAKFCFNLPTTANQPTHSLP